MNTQNTKVSSTSHRSTGHHFKVEWRNLLATITSISILSIGMGESKSKKRAKQAAAKNLLDKLAGEKISEEFYSNQNSTGNAKTPSTVLLELMQKQNRTSSYVLIEEAPYQCKVSVEGITFEGNSWYLKWLGWLLTVALIDTGFGEGNSKTEAKIVASKELLDKLINTTSTTTPLDEIVSTESFHTENSSTPSIKKKKNDSPFEFDLKNSNFVGALKSMCKLQKLPDPVFEIQSNVGPAHLKTFTMKCFIQTNETFGKGNSLRQAKQDAAKAMWNLLKDRMNI